MRLSATATNSAGSATASSAPTAVVAGTPVSYVRRIGIQRYTGMTCTTSNLGEYARIDTSSDLSSWRCAASGSAGLALGYFQPVKICTVLDDGIRYSVANNGTHENWFLHNSSGQRLLGGNDGGGTCYISNPGITSLQDEFRTHTAALAGSVSGADGFYWDNFTN